MIPLAACSIMALAIILERALMWWRVGRRRDPEAVLTRAAKGEWTEACKLGKTSRSPASDAALAHACPADHELRAHAVRRWLDRLRPADFDDARTAPTSPPEILARSPRCGTLWALRKGRGPA